MYVFVIYIYIHMLYIYGVPHHSLLLYNCCSSLRTSGEPSLSDATTCTTSSDLPQNFARVTVGVYGAQTVFCKTL